MKSIAFVACAAFVVAGCNTTNDRPVHRLDVKLSGADTAYCVSPQSLGGLTLEAPGTFVVEPEQESVEVICNAEGYQETYAFFEEVYVDGSAGNIALGAIGAGVFGAIAMANADNADNLPNSVTLTMVPEGGSHSGALAVAEYEAVKEPPPAVTSLSPAYTFAEPPEGSTVAKSRAQDATDNDNADEIAAIRADLRRFETRLKGSKTLLTDLLNRYNHKAEFARSPHTGVRVNIKDVSRLSVIDQRPGGYVVRVLGNSGLGAASWSDDVYDEHFLIDDRRGGLRIMAHGKQLVEHGGNTNMALRSAKLVSANGKADLKRFESQLRSSKRQLVALLNHYNEQTEFKKSNRNGARLKIKDVTRSEVIEVRESGYVVRVVGNSGLSAASWSDEVYDELFLIDSRTGGLRILAHGEQLASTAAPNLSASGQSASEAELQRFEARLRGSKGQLTSLLNDYNRDAGFARLGNKSMRIKDVARVQVLAEHQRGYVVRIVGNSSVGAAWSQDVYDELFLIDSRAGGLRIVAHGQQLERQVSLAQ